MQFLELCIRVIGVGHACTFLHIRVCHSRIRWTSTVHSRISIWPLVQSTALLVDSFTRCKSHLANILLFAVIASRKGGALVLDDFLKYIVQNALGIIRIVDLSAYTKYVSTFLDIVLNVIIHAFIGKLCHLNLFTCELLIEIVQVQARWWKLL